MTEPSRNHDVIERCRKGDRLAQEQLYKQYYKAMYNVSFRLLNDQVEAEDVMQESFLAAFTKINTYQGTVSFGSWLKRIVINRSIDVLRMRKMKMEEINEKTEVGQNEVADFEVDEQNIQAAVLKIKEAIKLLPEGFRVVLSLFFFEGYDHAEIAHILNISESTSRSQLVRAKKRLVEFLKQKKT